MDVQILEAEEKDTEEIWKIMECTRSEMPYPDWYVIDDQAFVRRHVEKEGFILKAQAAGKILGFLLIHFPGKEEEEHLGNYLHLTEAELGKVAYMDSVAVRREARGLGLMGKLMDQAQMRLESLGYCYLMGTVHPDNKYSHANFARLGYADIAFAKKYGGLPRIVVCKRVGGERQIKKEMTLDK